MCEFAEGERCQALRACAGTAVQAVLFLHTPLGRVGLQALVQSDWSFGAFGAVVRPRRTPSSRSTLEDERVLVRSLRERGSKFKSPGRCQRLDLFIKVISVLCYYLTDASYKQYY